MLHSSLELSTSVATSTSFSYVIGAAQDITPMEYHTSSQYPQSLPSGGHVQLGLPVVGFASVVWSPVVLARLLSVYRS
jgi:hypothetical protein